MDLRLPLLADANLHLGVAEEALLEEAFQTARREWEKADAALSELEEDWPEGVKERGLFQAMYDPLCQRSDAIKKKLPKAPLIAEIEKKESLQDRQ